MVGIAIGCLFVVAILLSLIGLSSPAIGLLSLLLVGIPMGWIESAPSRARKLLAKEGKACAHCWGLFESGDKRHPYQGLWLCEAGAKSFGISNPPEVVP